MQGLGLSLAKPSAILAPSVSDPNWWTGDGVNDYISGTGSPEYVWTDLNTQDISWSFWVRIDSTTKKNQNLFSLSASTSSTNNAINITYNSEFNRLIYRQRWAGTNVDRQFPLHNNGAATGVTNIGTGWCSTQRGLVNSDGFTNITITHDASSAATGIKCYWNGVAMSTFDVTNNPSITKTNWNPVYLGIGDYIAVSNPTAGALGGAINEIKMYGKVLTQAEVTSVYNSGVAANASGVGVTSGLITEWSLNSSTTDSGGYYTSTNNGGTFS